MSLEDSNELQTTALTTLPWSSVVLTHNTTGPDSQESHIVHSDAVFQQLNLTENEPPLPHTSNQESGYTTFQSADSESSNLYGPIDNTALQQLQQTQTEQNSFEILQNDRIERNRIPTTCVDSLEGQSLASSFVVEDLSGKDLQGTSLTSNCESLVGETQAFQPLHLTTTEPPREDAGDFRQDQSNRESGYATLQEADSHRFPLLEPIDCTAPECLPLDLNSADTQSLTERAEPCRIPTTVLELLEGLSGGASDSFLEDKPAESFQRAMITSGSGTFDNENQGAAALYSSQLASLTDLDDYWETASNISLSSLISWDSLLLELDSFLKLKAGNNKTSSSVKAEAGARVVDQWEIESSFSFMSTSGMSADDLDFEDPEDLFESEEIRDPLENSVETPGDPQDVGQETDVAQDTYLMMDEDEFDHGFGVQPNTVKHNAGPTQQPPLLFPDPFPSHLQPLSDVLSAETPQDFSQLVPVSTGEINGDDKMNSFSGQIAEPSAQAAECIEGCGSASVGVRPGNFARCDEVLIQLETFVSPLHEPVPLVEAIQESDQVQSADIILNTSFGNADQLPFPQPNDVDVAIDLRRGHDFIYVATCVACAVRTPKFVNHPCEHLTFCETCKVPGLNCPTCHTPIMSYEPC